MIEKLKKVFLMVAGAALQNMVQIRKTPTITNCSL